MLSKAAKLSRTYTNHCISAISNARLNSLAGFEHWHLTGLVSPEQTIFLPLAPTPPSSPTTSIPSCPS
jgi:hypothetical protein